MSAKVHHFVLFLVALLLSTPCHAGLPVKAGGLLAYPTPVVGPNLLRNATFDDIDARTEKPAGWRLTKAFSIVRGAGPGKKGLILKDAPAFPYAESASQELFLSKGSYRFGGRVKTALSDPKPKGVRFSLGGVGSTPIASGTTEWHLLSTEKIYVPKDGKYIFRIEAYSEPAGTALFEDLFLKREAQPLEAFLLYPNYRGLLFDDQSQVVKLNAQVEIPQGKNFSEYGVTFTLHDERSGKQIYSASEEATASFIHRIDCSKLPLDKSYIIHSKLIYLPKHESVYEYPAYRIVKVPSNIRKKMNVSFDEHNRFLLHDKPSFLLGVYDSGMGYTTDERSWKKVFKDNRRLFDLPINLYLNYWYGQASLKAMQTMMNVLQKEDVFFLQTANAFNATYDPNYFALDKDDGYLRDISEHPGLAGFYTADEAVSSMAPVMFEQYWRLKSAKPDGITFATFLDANGLRYWRDTVDVLSMDPYPLVGAEPMKGYNLAQVADWTNATRVAVMESRPFVTVLQFFKQGAKGRWPTRDELRNMSYMAITEGANGLMYWSLGVKALAYVCKDWCDERVNYFESLKTVLWEIKELEPALTGIDQPSLLLQNSNAEHIHTRVKFVKGKGYLFAYNHSNIVTSATFSWFAPPVSVNVHKESRNLSARGQNFSDNFKAYEAHVYEVSTREQ